MGLYVSKKLSTGARIEVRTEGKFMYVPYKNGKKEWEFDAGAGIATSPAIAGGRIVIGTQDGRVYCFG